jgi:serine/threonine protein kinase
VRDKDLRTLVREMQVMKLLNHRNVVRLYEIIDTPDAFYLVLEVCAAVIWV